VELVGKVPAAQQDLIGVYVLEEDDDDDRQATTIYKRVSKDEKVAFFMFYKHRSAMWVVGPVAGSPPYLLTCKSLDHLHPEMLSSGWQMRPHKGGDWVPVKSLKTTCRHTPAPTTQPTTAAPTAFKVDLGEVGAGAAVATKADNDAPEVTLGAWRQIVDKDTGAFFYFNTKTRETQIKPPPAFQKLIAQSKTRAFTKVQMKEVAREQTVQREAAMVVLYHQARPFMNALLLLGLVLSMVFATWYGLQSAWQSSEREQHELEEAAANKVRIPTIYKRKVQPKKEVAITRSGDEKRDDGDDDDDDGEALMRAMEVGVFLCTLP
jgi:hypothetical protein